MNTMDTSGNRKVVCQMAVVSAVAVAVATAWKLVRRKRRYGPTPSALPAPTPRVHGVPRGHSTRTDLYSTAHLQHPSRQQHKIKDLDEPHYPLDQRVDDKRSIQKRLLYAPTGQSEHDLSYGPAAVLYVNRAVCHVKLQAWDRAQQDCRSALSREPAHVQAHYLLGTALKGLGKLSEAIEQFRQAYEGASRQDDQVKARIWVARNDVKYEVWLQESIARKHKQQQLQTHILQTMCKAHAAQMDAMSASSTNGQGAMEVLATEALESRHHACAAAVRSIFEQADAELEMGTPDPLFICPLTQEIFRDPVCAPSGTSFERCAINTWLDENNMDPITRGPLQQSQLWANIALRDASHKYLEDHPWAWVL